MLASAPQRRQPAIGDPWGEIAAATRAQRNSHIERTFASPVEPAVQLCPGAGARGRERQKPDAERLPGFSTSALPLLEKSVTDERPITPWIEQLRMEWSLSKAREYLGADHPQTKLLLGRESPEALAQRLVSGTRLGDAAVRKALWNGGAAAVAASTDPLIVYARSLDDNARALQKRFDAEVDAPLTAARARLADARFAAFGDSNYPDATFTLRISYGKVEGWTENGRPVPTRTLLGGTFDRATGAVPFDLPPAFVANQARINKNAVYNFVTTNDIIGGNSGSPVIDKAGTVIGAAFDGNIHSLGGNYGYDGTLNRTVVVSTAAVQEALEKIYPAPNLVAELRGKRR
jgi:hypothetical protein